MERIYNKIGTERRKMADELINAQIEKSSILIKSLIKNEVYPKEKTANETSDPPKVK